jgi:type II secretory pathway pseudopilin PulG
MREKNNGQSLVEVLIAVAIGAILITGGVMLIVPALQSNSQATKVQAASLLGKQLLDNVRVWSEGNWNNVLALSTGTSYAYYMNTSISPFTVATGTESIVVVTSTVSTSSLTSGLVGYWPFDEGTGTVAYDYSGNNVVLNLTNSPLITWQSGKIGASAINYAASVPTNCTSGPGVQSPSVPSIIQNLPSGNFSVSFWAQNPSSHIMFHLLTNMTVSGNFQGIYFTAGTVAIANNSGVNTGFSFSVPGTTGWHLFTYVFNLSSSSQTMYEDGVSEGSGSLSGSYGTVSQINVGDYATSCSDAAAGSTFDDVRVYNRALSTTEISQLYALGQSNVTYTRYFYLSDVYRDGSGNIVTSGGTYDPSTKQITVVYSWPNGPVNTMTTYIVRGRNNVVSQNGWSGGPGVTTPETSTNNQFASSTNVDYQTSTGAIYVAIPGY